MSTSRVPALPQEPGFCLHVPMDSMDVTDCGPNEEIPPGTTIAITGLKAKPELNGQLATVESLAENGRYNVRLASGDILALKPEALLLEHGSAEEHALKSETLLESGEYAKAVLEAETALDNLPLMARAALARGRGLLVPALIKRDEDGTPLTNDLLEEAGRAFNLAGFLDGECEEADDELERVQMLQKELEGRSPAPPATVSTSSAVASSPPVAGELDVIIVGAGAAGVGCALMLIETFALDASRVQLIERGEGIGDTFRRWPAEMRFISPSFNQQGWTSSFDLNSISHGTSLAYSLHSEHPSGTEYAAYLNALAERAKLNVRTLTEVVSIQAEGVNGGSQRFSVEVRTKPTGDEHAAPSPKGATEKLKARYAASKGSHTRPNSARTVVSLWPHSARSYHCMPVLVSPWRMHSV